MIPPRVLLADDHAAFRLCPDVIVADISMPGLSGIDAARQLREFASSAKIVFLTIHSEEQFVEACMAEGALGMFSRFT